MGTESLNTIDFIFLKPDWVMISLDWGQWCPHDCLDCSWQALDSRWFFFLLSNSGSFSKDWISSSLPVLADCSRPWPAFFPLAAWCGPPMGAWMTLTATESRPLEPSCPPFIQPRPTSSRDRRWGLSRSHHLQEFLQPNSGSECSLVD